MTRPGLTLPAVVFALITAGCSSEVVVEGHGRLSGPPRCHTGYDLVDGVCRIHEVRFDGGSFVMGRGYCYPASDHAKELADGRCSLSDEPHVVSVGPFTMDAVQFSGAEGGRDFLADQCPSFSLDCVPPDSWIQWDSHLPLNAQEECARDGKTLPTERQWEYAASAGGTRTYPWGEDPPTCERVGIGDHCPRKYDIAIDPPSPEGLYNLAGAHAEMVLYDEPFEKPGYPDTPGMFNSQCDTDDCKRLITRGGDGVSDKYPFTFAELRTAHRGTRRQATFRCVRNL